MGLQHKTPPFQFPKLKQVLQMFRKCKNYLVITEILIINGTSTKTSHQQVQQDQYLKTSQIMWLDRHMYQCNGNASVSRVPYRFSGSFTLPPLGFTPTLCSERWEHCHSISTHLSCHSGKDQGNMLWTVPSHHLWSPMDSSLWRFTSHLLHEEWTEYVLSQVFPIQAAA